MAGQFVFGYGSLAADAGGRAARLEGWRRVWGVAMDNSVTIAGYKYYRSRVDGSRPAVWVAFLDIVDEPAAVAEGVVFAVDATTLAALDARERNYERIDVSGAVVDPPGRVWGYRGSAAGRERLRVGRERGCAVVDRGYLAALRDAPDPDGLALMDLERVALRGPTTSANAPDSEVVSS